MNSLLTNKNITILNNLSILYKKYDQEFKYNFTKI